MYDFLLAVHLLAAVMWVGGGVTLHLMGRLATAAGGERLVAYTREANTIGPRLYAPLSLLLLTAGILLVDEAGYEFSQAWISIALAGWLVSFALGVGFYPGQQKKLEEIVASEGPDAPRVMQVYDRVQNVNLAELGILLLVVVDMAVKPGA